MVWLSALKWRKPFNCAIALTASVLLRKDNLSDSENTSIGSVFPFASIRWIKTRSLARVF